MMKKLAITLAAAPVVAVVALAAFVAVPARAADTYTIDKAHSEAAFQVRHLVTKVRGQFNDFSGTIKVDSENPASSSVTFEIDAASINTSNADRDKHLRSGDFFDVANHPKITFQSKSVTKTGESSYSVTGDLTMRGVTREITLPVEFLGQATDPWGNTKGGFETTTTLNRKDFGISWNAALDQGGYILGDDVTVIINLETALVKPAEPASK